MANTTSRQTALFGTEDWKKLYKTYKDADFQSFNFETMRKTFVDTLKNQHPETFNDFTESSEFVALLDVMAFMGQSLSFRNDLNSRENLLDTAERRDSVTRLAKLVSYNPKRNESAKGFVRIDSVSTTENIFDYNQNNLQGVSVQWNDKTNPDWQEQFTAIINAALVNSQKVGNPGNSAELIGIQTDEYQINISDGYLPVIPFAAEVDNVNMNFELVNGTSVNKNYIYEPAPQENGQFNILYRNDKLGFGGANTGFFFYFKQGTLLTHDFNLTDQIANRTYEVDLPGINESDVWLYKNNDTQPEIWERVENIYSTHDDQKTSDLRKFYSVTSRTNDQITLLFGDGVFSTIPIGSFRVHARSSNGLEYVISPAEIQGVEVSLSYTSKSGRTETITFTISSTKTVGNAKSKESLIDIKRRAPARFYTQNRMVNGEDYNILPYASFGSIIKSKAVNRSNIGASRYLDLVDPTGKFSSINTFGHDGVLYQDSIEKTFSFVFNDRNDIQTIITSQIEPIIASRGMLHFYYNNFPREMLTSESANWVQSTTFTNETTGYFIDSNNLPIMLGKYADGSSNFQYVNEGSLIKFSAPLGTHFTASNKLENGAIILPGDKMEIWASIKQIELDGTNYGQGNFSNGIGPVILNNFVPTRSVPVEIITPFTTHLPVNIKQQIVAEIELLRNFGLRFDHLTSTWHIITHDNIDITGEFDLLNAGDDSNIKNDASWLISFVSTSAGYTVTSRSLDYYFASILETRFFHDDSKKIYDPRQGSIVNDYIKILKTNTYPDSHNALDNDITLDIIGQTVEPDGYVNDFNVAVSFTDLDSDGIADDPDFFNKFVNQYINTSTKSVFFQSTIDFGGLERILPLEPTAVNNEYATPDIINIVKTQYSNGQIFYAYSNKTFWELSENTLIPRTDYYEKIGRNNIYFQYRHNSPETRRINPGVSNIIDLYIVTNGYYEAYMNYIRDNTNVIEEPVSPSTDVLLSEYEKLQDKRMTSDNVILSSVTFKPLFGAKASINLQAVIKVVKLQNSIISNSEIKSKVITEINNYFDINIWDFGDTFYFSELSAVLHKNLGDIISSVVILSKDTTKSFGDLYEIKSQPNEIFVSSATVSDIEIIDTLTPSKLQNGEINGQ